MTYQSEVLADSPLAFWRLDEAAANAADAAGGAGWPFGAGVTVAQSPLVADGGYSVRGSGTAPICTIGSVPSGLSGANVTLEAWVSLPGTNVKGSFVKVGSSSNGWGMGIGGSQWDNVGQKLILLSEAVAWHPTSYTFPGAGTYHVMVVRGASGAVTAYVNGSVVWSGTLTSPIAASGQMGVGGYTEPYGFKLASNVGIDNVALYASALSAARVTAHYNGGSGSNTAVAADAPTAWLKLDDTTATPSTTFADSSGNGRTAAITGTPAFGSPAAAPYIGGTSADLATGQWATVPNPAWINSLGALTVEAWFKTTSASLQAIATMDNTNAATGGTERKFALYLDSAGKLTWMAFTTGGTFPYAATAAAYNDGAWHHVVAARSASTLTIYVDGVSVATQAIGGTLTTASSTVDLHVGTIRDSAGPGKYQFIGSLDEVALYSGALSASRVAAHYAAATTAPAGVTFDGGVAATSDVAGTVTARAVVAGQADAVSTVDGSVSATFTLSGQVDAISAVQGSVLSGVEYPIDGQVDATSGVEGTLGSAYPFAGQTDAVSDVEGDLSASIALNGQVAAVSGTRGSLVSGTFDGVEAPTGATLEVGPVTLLNLVALAGVELRAGMGAVTAGDSTPVVPLPGTNLAVGATLDGQLVMDVPADPRRSRTQWRYVVTDLANQPLGELVDIQHDPVADGVNTPTTMRFTMAADDPARGLIESGGTLTRKCQVWAGNELLLWGPLLPDQSDGSYTVHDPSWYWRGGRRVIGRLPRLNLLKNGDFKQGLAYWTGGYDRDSIPKAKPAVQVVSEDFLEDTDGLDPIRALEITGVESVTEAELSSNAVFYPNLAKMRPGGKESIEAVANAMPTTAGLKVTVVGHTANDGTGDGMALSKRRADAAAAIIHAKRPSAVITTKGVGYYQPKPGFPIGSQAQRRVVIQYDQTISGESKQWVRQRVEVTQPKSARYPLVLTAAAMLKVADDWSIEDANMMSVRVLARRKTGAKPPTSIANALAEAQADYNAALAELARLKGISTTTSDQLESARQDVADAKAKLADAQYDADTAPWDLQLGEGSTSISDTDPVDRWMGQSAEVTIPADGRVYVVDVYLYAPAALARYTAVGLFPEEELYFWGQDQALIFKGIVEHIQNTALGHGNLGIETRTPLTGIKRDRTYLFRDHMPADTALEEFGGLNRGMDYDTIMQADGRVILSTFYPQQGKTKGFVLVQGGNVVNASPERSRDVASSVIMQAQNIGAYRAEAYAKDARALGGLLLERVVTAEQETPLNELREAARQELEWGRLSTTGYWLDIDPDSIDEVLANTGKGDVVRLILDSPVPVDRLGRIVNRERHPDSLRLLVALDQEV